MTKYIWIRHNVITLVLIGGSFAAVPGHSSACNTLFRQLQRQFHSHEVLKIGVDIDNTLIDGIPPVSTHLLPQVIKEIDLLLTPEHRQILQAFLARLNPRYLPPEYTLEAWQRPPWNFPVHAIPPDLDKHFGLAPQPSLEALWQRMSNLFDDLVLTGHPFEPIRPVIKLLRRLQRWKSFRWTFLTARQPHLAASTHRQLLGTHLVTPQTPYTLLMGASTPTRTSQDRSSHKAQQVLSAHLDLYLDDNTAYLREISHRLGSQPFPKLLQVVRDPHSNAHHVRFYSASSPSP